MKKMEMRLNIGGEFCQYEKEFQTVVIIPIVDGDWRTLDSEPYIKPPEFC
jgi:hypothetical protein